MADLWSDYTDGVITTLDDNFKGKFKMTIRDFLTNPAKYAKQPDIGTTANNMWESISVYIDHSLQDMSELKIKLDKDVQKASAVTQQLSQNINLQAKQSKVPMVKPHLLYRDQTRDEVIYIDTVDVGVLSLVEKLVGTSNFIADSTSQYESMNIGEWYFSGKKQYVLRVYLPPNEVLSLEAAKDELQLLFDSAKSFINVR